MTLLVTIAKTIGIAVIMVGFGALKMWSLRQAEERHDREAGVQTLLHGRK